MTGLKYGRLYLQQSQFPPYQDPQMITSRTPETGMTYYAFLFFFLHRILAESVNRYRARGRRNRSSVGKCPTRFVNNSSKITTHRSFRCKALRQTPTKVEEIQPPQSLSCQKCDSHMSPTCSAEFSHGKTAQSFIKQ